MKLNHEFEWTPRQLALTVSNLCFSFVGEDCMRDNIFLHEVTFVSSRDHLPGLGEQNESKGQWNQNSAWYSIKEQDRNIFAFEVQTTDHGYNSGRSYYFGTRSKEERGLWVSKMQDTITASKLKRQAEENSRWTLAQIHCKRFYDSDFLQGCVAFLIFSNFVANVAQSELQPIAGSFADSSFTNVDTFFTAIFALELCVNLFANWFWPFFCDGWSCFDFVVVVVSLVSLGVSNVPGISFLRLMRAFRVLRLFGRLRSLRQIINALTSAILPVCNAFLIMGLVTCLYAILAVNFFRDKNPDYFGSFFRSLFTMFQVCTGDNWSDIARSLFPDQEHVDSGVIFFFVSFHVIVGWTLLQVVVAVLIDNFTASADEEKEKAMKEKAMRQGKNVAISALDPILAALAHFNTSQDLSNRVMTLFKVLDADDSKSLSYEELASGLKKLKVQPTIHLSEEDFHMISNQRLMCDHKGELSVTAFETIMRRQLKLFVQRQLAHAMGRTDENDPSGTILFVLKLLTISVDELSSRNVTARYSPTSTGNEHMFSVNSSCMPLASGSIKPTEIGSAGAFQEQKLQRRAELEQSIHILEEQAAQLQSSLNSHNEVLEEILLRLARTRPSGGGIILKKNGLVQQSNSLVDNLNGPKNWLDKDSLNQTLNFKGASPEYVCVLSSRIIPSSESIDPKPLMTPRSRITKTNISPKRPATYQATRPGSDDKLANKISFFHQLPAKVPRSSVNGKERSVDLSEVESESQEQSDLADSVPLPAPIIARDCTEEHASPNVVNGSITPHNDFHASVAKTIVEEEYRASQVAGHLWRELEKAVRGKTLEQSFPPNLQPREISTTPANMFAALFAGPNTEGSSEHHIAVNAAKGEDFR
uniref:EF-hand domain-containing protein n=1 Tax=Cryptomonas curvata TaxID=233186 RepID=A0A7S0QNQ4_9CRYP